MTPRRPRSPRSLRSRRPILATSGLLLAAALTACGTTDTEGGDAPAPEANEAGDCADDDTATSTGPVTLTDAAGRTVELDQPAERVVSLEWQQTEDVLSLCLTPVGVADAEGYSYWNRAEELPEGVEDVGLRGEPNLDALFATDPDLVITEVYGPDDEVVQQLEKYDVPVLATLGANADDPIQQMKDTFDLIAQATGREERAAAVVEEFDQALADASDDIAAADLPTTDFVYLDGYIDGSNVALRPFGQGSLMGELGEEIGLTNVWDGKVDPAYGLGQTDIEGMTAVGDATLFRTGTADPEGDVNAALEENPIWSSLPAVEEGRTHDFPDGVWTFGGPRSAQLALDAYVAELTS